VGRYLPGPLLRLIAVPHGTTKHWVPPKPERVSIDTRLQRRPKAVRRSVESEGLMGREKAGCVMWRRWICGVQRRRRPPGPGGGF
jgi:hypothetical protein